ncbi:hypothetical protein BX667DRAFT_491691 [Coemansia mojavensis]|nr:hypothetical protein BX667DRAFT_491691 [Coemansia mojavensis]
MKFGKHIQAQTIPEWAAHYMNYKALKKIINELSAPLSPTTNSAEAAKQRLQTVKASFFFQVDRELEKVNTFYLQKEADTKVRLKSLIEKQRNLRSRGPRNRTVTMRALHEAFLNSRHDLDKLQNFVEINGTGFRKILKKWDKRSKSSTKELYLARQVEVQPCFNQDVIAELSDMVTKCLSELEHALDQAAEDPLPPREPQQGELGFSGFLLDMGISRGVQVDRAEAELFHALSLSSTQKAGELLEQYKAQQTDVQRSCVTRVLWRACSEIREPEKQQMLLDSGLADLHSVDDINERTLVHEASIHGSLAILQAAVAAGCDPDEADYYDRRPVHYAAINSHIDCLKFLIDKGSSVCAIDDDGSHAFDYAMINGHVECVRMLLDHDPNIVCGDSEYPVLALACEKGHEDIVHMLLEAGAKLSLNAQGMHPMHVAARAGYTGILRMLLDHGAPVNVLDKDLGWTPVFYAANEGNVECIRVLLDSGCNLDVLDENGRGPTYFAASEGHMECVDVLIKAAGAKIDEDDKTSSTAKADTNADLDLDAIPSLSLPPPLIPFRVYGHNFLGKRTRIHIRMHSRSGANASPVSFVDHRDTVSLKLVAVAKPDAGMVPHTIMLPMETSSTMFGFQTDSLDNFRIEFMLYPSFGLQPIGKAVALASQFTDASSGIAQLPLLDRYLKVVAEISFEFLVIRPFEGAQLQIGGKVETYWKSTNPALQQNAHSMAVSAMVPGAIFTSPTSVTDSLAGAGAGAGGIPIIISSSLAPEHVCIQVQVCRDGVPVVSPRMYIDVGSPSGVKLRIHSLTYSELQGAMRAESNRQAVDSNEKPDGQNGTASEWHQYLYDSGLSLEKVLEMLPTRFGVSLQVLDNSLAWSGTNSKLRSQRHDINDYIDAILKTVYQDSLKSAPNTQRNTIFCSYSPSICVALNWKQPNYAVFLMTSGREAPDSDDSFNKDAPSFGPYTNHLPLKEAVRFASANNILGIMCRSSLLTRVPSLIRNVKDNGLLLVSFGRENYDEQLCAAQKSHGVDAIICDGTIKYETEDNVEYVI